MDVGLELDELEDRHESLTGLKHVEPGSQLARAAASEVVEQVVAVRGDAELAEPAEENRCGRADVDAAVGTLIGRIELAIAGVGLATFGGRRPPGARGRSDRALS